MLAPCRHGAWEQARAAASGRSAVCMVELLVTVPATTPKVTAPRQMAWVDLLGELGVVDPVGRVPCSSSARRRLPVAGPEGDVATDSAGRGCGRVLAAHEQQRHV